ncbi:MAG: protease TldD, partial [Pseudomonadota bacterium]
MSLPDSQKTGTQTADIRTPPLPGLAPSSAIDLLPQVRAGLLTPAGLDDGLLQGALDLVLGKAVDSADLYFQLSQEESWALEDGIVKEGSASIEQGVGVRAMAGERTGFAYSDELMPAALEEA